MASRLEPMIIEVKADVDQANAEIAKLKAHLTALSDHAHKAASPMGKLKEQIMAVGKVAAAGFGIMEGIKFLDESAHAAVDNAKSLKLMEVAMHNATGASHEQVLAANEHLEKLSEMSGVLVTNIRPAFDIFTRVTHDSEKALRLQELALNVSAGTGKDLTTVSLAMSRAISGNSASLNKLMPGAKNAKDQMAFLEKAFKGAAKAAADTDPFSRINVAMEKIKVSLGTALLPIFDTLAKLLTALNPVFESLGQIIQQVVDAAMPFINEVLDAIIPLLKPIMDIIGNMIKVALIPLKIIFGDLMIPIKILTSTLGFFLGILKPIWDIIGKLADLIQGAFSNAWAILQKAMAPVVAVWKKDFAPMFEKIGPWIESVGKKIIAWIAGALAKAMPYIIMAANWLGKNLANALKWVHDRAVDFGKFMAGPWGTAIKIAVVALNPLLGAILILGEFMGKKIANFKMPKVEGADDKGKLPETPLPEVPGGGSSTAAKTAAPAQTAMQKYHAALLALTGQFKTKMAALLADHTAKMADITQKGVDSLTSILEASKGVLQQAFREATKIDAGQMFLQAGASVDNMLEMLKDKISKSKKLAEDVAKLNAAGYSQQFINEIVAQGADVGDALTQQLLSATPEKAKELQGLLGEAGAISTTGVDSVADAMLKAGKLATDDLTKQYAQAQSDLTKALNAENELFIKSNNETVRAYEVAQAKITLARDNARIAELSGDTSAAATRSRRTFTADIAKENSIISAGGSTPVYQINTTVTANTNATPGQIASDVVNGIRFATPVLTSTAPTTGH
jgi:hypothetical protein